MSATDDIAEVKLAGYFIEWDAIEDAKAKLAERSKDLGKAMKDEGFNTKAARTSFREQRTDLNATQDDIAKAEEEEKVIDLYRAALKKGLAFRAHPAPAHEKTLRNSGSKATSYAEAKGVETNSPETAHGTNPSDGSVNPHGEPVAVAANMENDHVDSSAERASSAVQFGATNSPERAQGIPAGSHDQRHDLVAGPEDQLEKEPLVAADAVASVSAPNSHSSEPTSSKAETKTGAVVSPPAAAPVAPFNNPRCQHSDTCHFAGSRDCCHDCLMDWAKRPKDEQTRLWAEANEAARVSA